jgi:EAL domain-containing protein (putative c-di-GMP-specific phosphodiesterase class I)
MEDREGQLISPGMFLESADRFGLSVPIDYMVIRKAARRIGTLPGEAIWISLNLARASLEDVKLFDHIETAVKENKLKPGQLHIEITETVAMEYLDQVRSLILKLKTIGCRSVLDDFGHGLAYRYLQQLPVDMVKIDGELIRDLVTRDSTRALVRNLTEMAHEQGMQVAAKCVEDEALLDQLVELDIDYAQGFAIGKPVEAIEQSRLFVPGARN